MENKPRTIVIRALGDLSPEQRLWANCEHCGHSRKLDLDDLRTKYGTRMPIRRLGRMPPPDRKRPNLSPGATTSPTRTLIDNLAGSLK